ncbi:Glycerophosphoryl diester phosphodiesterase family [Musa troglodytarum]|uniref:glycerophosphodiester phosphodiesterase n=1 Tax=Musa troglodytarum TaxID=320322 RepID=A0A9E7FDT2_9LILI|nr:Glycerophosphoryl diester phosphodiesterase family [Musa troglodytarum]URD94152.1 Glycerophosphoryl diester phosphodiesterase family [Musa troglodytarum]
MFPFACCFQHISPISDPNSGTLAFRSRSLPMALKAAHVSDVPTLDQVPATPSVALSSSLTRLFKGTAERLVVIGHRGKGMNALASPDRRLKEVKENSLRSFNEAARFAIDFVEFDVQVTKDDCPIIFHDNLILTEEHGNLSEKHVTDLCLGEFLSYGPQRDPAKVGKPLLRKTKDGRILTWDVEADDPFCTLQDAFQGVDSHLGFNIELKFDDHVIYKEEQLARALRVVLRVVFEFAKERPIVFSSFQPDAARLMRGLQNVYPVPTQVFFLTNGGTEIYRDARRNSLDEAVKLCMASGLQGIVSEVRAFFRNPAAAARIKESNLALLTYGQLNNVPKAVYMQQLMGVNGVIVDLVKEITEALGPHPMQLK